MRINFTLFLTTYPRCRLFVVRRPAIRHTSRRRIWRTRREKTKSCQGSYQFYLAEKGRDATQFRWEWGGWGWWICRRNEERYLRSFVRLHLINTLKIGGAGCRLSCTHAVDGRNAGVTVNRAVMMKAIWRL
jgi:hypothetical protein